MIQLNKTAPRFFSFQNWLLFLFLSLVIIEVIAYFFGKMGWIGMYLWLLLLISLLLVAVYSLVRVFQISKKSRSYYSLGAIVLLVGLIFFKASQSSNISGETTQESSCAIRYWNAKEDKGFQQLCFLGYPSRQYLLMALPTMVFGPSLFVLNLGGSLYFLIGLSMWSIGLLSFLNQRSKESDKLVALSILLLPHFYFFNHFLLHLYEQSQFPLSIGMIFWGVFFWQLAEEKNWKIYLLGLILLLLVQAYTPALAFIPMAIILLVNLVIKKKISIIQLVAIIFGMTVCLAISTTYRSDIKLVGNNNRDLSILVNDVYRVFVHIFYKTQGAIEYASPLGRLALIGAFISPIIIRSKKAMVILFWIIGTMLVATLSQGYSFYHLNFRIHRSIVVLPTIMVLLGWLFMKLTIKKEILSLLLLLTFISGSWYSFQYLSSQKAGEHISFINFIKSNIDDIDDKTNIIFSPKANNEFISLRDSMMYFIPNLEKTQSQFSYQANNNFEITDSILVIDAVEDEFVQNSAYSYLDYQTISNQDLIVVY